MWMNVNFLWKRVYKLKDLILRHMLFFFFPQIHSPNSNKAL